MGLNAKGSGTYVLGLKIKTGSWGLANPTKYLEYKYIYTYMYIYIYILYIIYLYINIYSIYIYIYMGGGWIVAHPTAIPLSWVQIRHLPAHGKLCQFMAKMRPVMAQYHGLASEGRQRYNKYMKNLWKVYLYLYNYTWQKDADTKK